MNDDFVSVLPDKIRHMEARIARLEDKVQMDQKRRKKDSHNDELLALGVLGVTLTLFIVRSVLARSRAVDEAVGAAFHPAYS